MRKRGRNRMKKAEDIIKYGKVKKYGFKKDFEFNSIDIETVNNEIFLLGYHLNDIYNYTLENFFDVLNDIFINLVIRKIDSFMREMRFHRDAKDALSSSTFDPFVVQFLEAYSAGVNEYLKR